MIDPTKSTEPESVGFPVGKPEPPDESIETEEGGS